MATYTYKCENEKCDIYNIPFDVNMSMKDKNLITCPDCNEDTLIKVIGKSGGFRIGGKGVNKPTAHWGS